MGQTTKIIIIVLLVINIAVPFFSIKVGYLEKASERKSINKALQQVKKDTSSIKSFLSNEEDFIKFRQTISDRRAVLKDLMPGPIRSGEVQKWLADFAKQNQIIEKSLKPLHDNEVVEIKKEKTVEETDFRLAVLEWQIEGTYENICLFIEDIEFADKVDIAFNQVNLQPSGKASGVIEAILELRVTYAKS